jgi:hypothetical protein
MLTNGLSIGNPWSPRESADLHIEVDRIKARFELLEMKGCQETVTTGKGYSFAGEAHRGCPEGSVMSYFQSLASEKTSARYWSRTENYSGVCR